MARATDETKDARPPEVAESEVPGWLRAILILPANVLGTVPALLLWWKGGVRMAGPGSVRLWVALACFAAGIALMATAIRLFHVQGRGTLAPWEPTHRLVVAGPYRYVRNPMISGVCLNLAGEALLFGSAAIAAWLALFFAANAVYTPLCEEPGLEARFGEGYRRYRRHVPRWIPRLRPWRP